jgi:ribosomal protein L37AE/L43A
VSAYLSTASLLLHPQSPEWFDHNADLINQCRALEFAGDAIDATSYYAGEHFLDHIAFMGCAPSIRFAPEVGNEKFTHIRLHNYKAITALIGEHAPAPNCPQCKKAFAYNETQTSNITGDSLWTCPHCQHVAAPWQYHWRRSAGFARVFIEITDIYPKEAKPQETLLDALRQFSGTEWQYCYLF